MELLPDDDEREHLLDRLAQLILAAGAETFVAAPIVAPDDRAFPDRWAGDGPSAYRLVRRLMVHAGLDELDLSLEVDQFAEAKITVDAHGQAQVTGHEGVAGWFAGIDGGVCRFGIDLVQLDDGAGAVGTLAHEVAHAWRAWQDVVDANRDAEERLTDLTTVYLGFGVLTANAALRFDSGVVGAFGSYWRAGAGGYLSPQAMCYLLAAQVVARGEDPRRVGKLLGTNQAACFRAACATLDREALIARLGLPLPALWPAPRALPAVRFDPAALAAIDRPARAGATRDDDDAGSDDRDAEEDAPDADDPAYRFERRPWSGHGILVGIGLAIVAGTLALRLGGVPGPVLFVVALFGLPALGARLGPRRRFDECADPSCAAVMPPDATRCPGCRRRIAGRVQHRADRLAD